MGTHKIEMEIEESRAYSAALVKVAERLETSLGRPDDVATAEAFRKLAKVLNVTREYRVDVSAMVLCRATVVVEADSVEEAERKAFDRAKRSTFVGEWEVDGDEPDDVEIGNVEPIDD